MTLQEQIARALCTTNPDAEVDVWVPERLNERTKPKRYTMQNPVKRMFAWEAHLPKANQIIELMNNHKDAA